MVLLVWLVVAQCLCLGVTFLACSCGLVVLWWFSVSLLSLLSCCACLVQ